LIRLPLSAADQWLAGCIGRARSAKARSVNCRDDRIAGDRGEMIDIRGARGEVAFLRRTGRPVDPDAMASGPDGGSHDAGSGRVTISVKTSQPRARWLLVPPRQFPPRCSAVAFLVDPGGSGVDLVGWIPAGVFAAWVQTFGPVDLGRGPTPAFPRGELWDPAEIIELASIGGAS